jgi:hypothetical protein
MEGWEWLEELMAEKADLVWLAILVVAVIFGSLVYLK